MRESAYHLAVDIGAASRRRLWRAVLALTIVIVLTNIGTLIVTTIQVNDLHNATSARNHEVAAFLAARTAHAQALSIASANGLRCILNIPPSATRPYSQTHMLINRCFGEFDRLTKKGDHP